MEAFSFLHTLAKRHGEITDPGNSISPNSRAWRVLAQSYDCPRRFRKVIGTANPVPPKRLLYHAGQYDCHEIVIVVRSERIISKQNGSNRLICNPLSNIVR